MKQIDSPFDFVNSHDVSSYVDLYKSISDEDRINTSKFQVMQFLLGPYLKHKKVVDIGCGEAFYSKWIANQDILQYIGIDLSELLIDRAKEQYKHNSSFKFIIGNFIELESLLRDSKYDVFLSIYSLMRVRDLSSLFQKIYTFLKPNGIFLIMSNTYTLQKIVRKAKIVEIIMNEKLLLKNVPRTIEEYIEGAKSVKFELVGYYSQPFSKNKKIKNKSNFSFIEGYDSILLFKKPSQHNSI